MRAIRFVVGSMLVAAFPAFAQSPSLPRVAGLDWMTGSWSQARKEGNVHESWVGPANGVMVAANLTLLPQGKHMYEFLRIADTDEGVSYFASPRGRAPTEFKLKEMGSQRVVFENPEKDFPRRILYWREGEFLKARIEGARGDKALSEEWLFARVPPMLPSASPQAPR